MRVLVTRPEPEASSFAAEIRALGHEPLLQPLLEFRVLDFELADGDEADALVLTSGNALRALEATGGVESLRAIPLFCVGYETAQKARAAGFTRILGTAPDGASLSREILRLSGGATQLVHLSGVRGAFDFTSVLRPAGLFIRTLNVYDMLARPAFDSWLIKDFEARRVDAVTLLSARTSEVFASLCRGHGIEEEARRSLMCCLSKAVASALAPLAPNVVRIAAHPARHALLKLLAAEFPAQPPSESQDVPKCFV
jgi:uroporphyrinogen-III synthase